MAYWEAYVAGIEKDWDRSGVQPKHFGHRIHELLENYYRKVAGLELREFESATPDIETEAEVMMEQYKLHYPEEPFEIVETERMFEVPLPGGKHSYTGKIDLVIRMKDTGKLWLLDHKSQKRNSYTNTPQAWAARAQVGLYTWAAEQLYEEPFDGIILNVLRRQSDKGQFGPEFWRDSLQRTEDQKDEAIRNIIWVADQIEQMHKDFGDGPNWPQDREQCQKGNFQCEFYSLHILGRTPETLGLYRPKKPYLDL